MWPIIIKSPENWYTILINVRPGINETIILGLSKNFLNRTKMNLQPTNYLCLKHFKNLVLDIHTIIPWFDPKDSFIIFKKEKKTVNKHLPHARNKVPVHSRRKAALNFRYM